MWLYFGFLMFYFVEAVYHPSKMCIIKEEQEQNEQRQLPEIEDCSFQFPGKEKICNVFSRNVCIGKTADLRNNVIDLETQLEAKFSVKVLPYNAVVNLSSNIMGTKVITQSPFISAINITFTLLNKDVTGMAVFIRDESVNITFCRLFQLEDKFDGIVFPIHLFYDCLYYMHERSIQNVTMNFISLPMKESLSYYAVLPPRLLSQNSLCKWRSLIMIFKQALSTGQVHVTFSTAPIQFNVSTYLVELINKSSKKKMRQISESEEEMGYVEFSSVEEGFYYVSVKPFVLENSTCTFPNTQIFYVYASYKIGKAMILLFSIFFLVVLFLVSTLKCCHLYYNQDLPYKQALLIYSEDNIVHKDFISSFASYLTYVHGINVSTIYGEITVPEKWIRIQSNSTSLFSKDPNEWIRHRYEDSDFIIYIISEGLYTFLQLNSHPYIQEMSHWRHQVSNAKNYISFQIFNSPSALKKRFCIVRFPYSNKKQIPSCIKDIGRSYQLPQEMDAFLGFLFNLKSFIPFINIYPKLYREDQDSLKKRKDFLNKLKIVKEAMENETFKVENNANLQTVLNKDNYLDAESEDYVLLDEKDSESKQNNPDFKLKGLEDRIKKVYNDSLNYTNEFTSLILEEFDEENV